LAASQALSQLAQGEQLLQALADAARQQQAQLPNDPDRLPAQDGLKTLPVSYTHLTLPAIFLFSVSVG
ncbi:hypothetical protein, partial [Xanthomonas fragariae]|uniref:hypothetical protein n=1 Tax=Xanthomonas fragariae TaxID=48664 RepID=UPI001F1A9C6B